MDRKRAAGMLPFLGRLSLVRTSAPGGQKKGDKDDKDKERAPELTPAQRADRERADRARAAERRPMFDRSFPTGPGPRRVSPQTLLLNRVTEQPANPNPNANAARRAAAQAERVFAATTILANEAVELCERVHDLLFDADDWREGLTHETVESALALAGEAQEKATAAENKAKEAWPPNGASETVWQAARNYGGEHAQGAASDAMGRAQTALQHARDAERWITERAFAALVGDQGEYRVLEQGAGVSDAKNAFRQHEKNYRKNPDDAHHIDQADDGSRPGENGTRRDQNAELRDDDERRARYVINDSEIEPFTDSEMALFIHMEVEQEDSETDMEEGRALDGQLDQDDDDDDAGVDGEYIDPRDVAVSTVRVDKEEEPEQADKRGGGDVDGDYNGEDSSNRMRLLKLANLRYRQTRCWLERMNGEGAPHELGTWLTNDEMRDIEMRVRAACVQWAREGGGHEPVGRTNPKGSPLIWAILMMLQVLAERHTPPRVLVHEREYTDGTETFRASTFYTMQGLWMYLERFGSQPCTDREPQNGANTGVSTLR